MKNIKFRVYGKENEIMYNWEDVVGFEDLTDFLKYPEENNYYSNLMAYTGLIDENGTEIYENDILKCRDRLVKVIWNNTIGSYDVAFLKYIEKDINMPNIDLLPVYFKYLKVVGNIYENPELT